LNFEKSSWKTQVRRTELIFAGYTGSKNPVRNRLKIQFVELGFSKLIFQKSSTDQQGEYLIDCPNQLWNYSTGPVCLGGIFSC
jgi:hypothetical protein